MDKNILDDVLVYAVEAKIKTTRSEKHSVLTFSGILVGFLISGCLFIEAFIPPYLNLFTFSIASIIAIISLVYTFSLFNYKRFVITSSSIFIQTNFFGKKRKTNIVGFGFRDGKKTEKESEEDKIAILFSDNQYEIIGSNSIYNFYLVKNFLHKHYNYIGSKAFKERDKLNSQLYLYASVIS